MKKLVVVMLLGVFLVVSLVGCGGGGPKDDEKGTTMDQATLTAHSEEVNEVGNGISIMGNYLEQIMATFTPTMSAKSQNLISMGEDEGKEDESPLEWTAECDKDGWYTAVTTYSEEGVYSETVTYKMRYFSDTQKIEFSEIEEYTYHDSYTYRSSTFTSIFKGNNGLWNGMTTTDISDSDEGNHSLKVNFENLDITNGCGEFTVWIDQTLTAEITITLVGENVQISGKYYHGGEPHEVSETLPVCTDADGETGGSEEPEEGGKI